MCSRGTFLVALAIEAEAGSVRDVEVENLRTRLLEEFVLVGTMSRRPGRRRSGCVHGDGLLEGAWSSHRFERCLGRRQACPRRALAGVWREGRCAVRLLRSRRESQLDQVIACVFRASRNNVDGASCPRRGLQRSVFLSLYQRGVRNFFRRRTNRGEK